MSDQKSEVVYNKDFLKDVHKLPIKCQGKLAELLKIIENDVFDSQLHTKPLSPPLQGLYSFRIVRDYRVGFKFYSDHVIQLLAADRRNKIYKRLKNKI